MNIVARIKFSGLMKVSTAQSATILILTVGNNYGGIFRFNDKI